MAHIFRFIHPYNLQFYQDYLKEIRVIQAHKSNTLITQDSETDKQLYQTVSRRLRLANIVMIIDLMHYVYKWLCPDPQDPIVVILNVDLMRMCQVDNALQIQTLLFIASIHFYYSRMLFVNFHPYFLGIYNDILFCNKLDHVFLPPLTYRGESIEKRLKRNALFTLQSLQLFFFSLHIFVLYLQINGLVVIASRGDYFDNWHLPLLNWQMNRFWARMIGIIFFEFSWTVIVFGLYYLIYIGTLLFIIISICFSTYYIIFKQSFEWCLTLCSTRVWLAGRLTAMLRYNRRSLVLSLHQTNYFGNMLLVFIVINIPYNCHMLGTILFGKLARNWILPLIIFMIHQWVVIFGCHILAVRINAAPFKPNKLLLSLAARRRLPLKTTVTLGLYLQTFHTKKGYGVGYGKLGLITMHTFAKFLLLYGEFIMYAYMIVTK